MKKTVAVATLALLAGAVSSYAQGTVSMGDYNGCGIQIFRSQATGNNTTITLNGITGSELMGNSGASYTDGAGPTVAFKGAALSGSSYTVELLAGASGSTLVSQLTEQGGATLISGAVWGPGPGYEGMWNPAPNFTTTFAASSTIAVAIAAWNNEGGTVTSLAQAVAANDPWGVSNVGSVTLGGGNLPAGSPTGLESFSLAVTTPEPSTIALGVIGASTLLFRRRNRK